MPFASEINKHKSTYTPYISFGFRNRQNAANSQQKMMMVKHCHRKQQQQQCTSIKSYFCTEVIKKVQYTKTGNSYRRKVCQRAKKRDKTTTRKILFGSRSAANLFTLYFNCNMLAAFFIYIVLLFTLPAAIENN